MQNHFIGFSRCVKWHLLETQVCMDLLAMKSKPQSPMLKTHRAWTSSVLQSGKVQLPQKVGTPGAARLSRAWGIFSSMHSKLIATHRWAATAAAALEGWSAHLHQTLCSLSQRHVSAQHHTLRQSKGRSLLDLLYC